jgi:hypothetical protein
LDRFSATFGCSPRVAAALWNQLDKKDLLPEDTLIKHLLWALSFLKLYNAQRAQAPVCGADEKTFRKWVWVVLDALAELDLVSRPTCRVSYDVSIRLVSTMALSASSSSSSSSSSTTDQMGEPVHGRQWLHLQDHCGWH